MSFLRVYTVVLAVFISALLIIARLMFLNLEQKEFLQREGEKRAIGTSVINVNRGMIQDRSGKPLAVSTPAFALRLDPSKILASDQDLSPLAEYLGVTPKMLREKVRENTKGRSYYLRRDVPPSDARKLLDAGLKGLQADRTFKRFYPAGEVAAHVVGIVNTDDKGIEGLELTYDKLLTGTPGQKKFLRNAHREVVKDEQQLVLAEPGQNLTVSLDLRLQYLAYKELKSAVSSFEAQSGSVIILDVESGEILAMVNQPSYNPNYRNYRVLDPKALRNRALTDVYEPGSTVKPLTVAAALETGKYSAESTIDTSPGSLKIGSLLVRDPSNRGLLKLDQVIAHSSQVGISKLALNLNAHEVRAVFDRMGIGKTLSIGFPGEETGSLPYFRRWKDIDRVTFAYGYGLTLTPAHLASAYMTIANDGLKRDLTLLKGGSSELTRVFSTRVAAQLKRMLSLVVIDGTGKKAEVDGYQVAGKTGTARKVGTDGYTDKNHLAFFAGLAPASQPKLVAVVLINDPQTARSGGGAIAAPVFSRVMTGALRILNIPPARKGSV
ncbi:MAG: peptidoglycan D,D-transpeptidase FtsI family protein [Candidatus Azotimanducaceae bacterium]|tara:strand:- start:763 stop:2418 length:1656 start_codon:yes stop_codon:yes gene_type:complete